VDSGVDGGGSGGRCGTLADVYSVDEDVVAIQPPVCIEATGRRIPRR
jgi:hypothetical protein